MGRIVSPAGEVAFNVSSLRRDGEELVIIGRMGIWDAKVYLPFKELLRLSPTAIPLIIFMLIMLPIYFFKRVF